MVKEPLLISFTSINMLKENSWSSVLKVSASWIAVRWDAATSMEIEILVHYFRPELTTSLTEKAPDCNISIFS